MEPTLDTVRQSLREAIHEYICGARGYRKLAKAADEQQACYFASVLVSFGRRAELIGPDESTDWSGVLWRDAPLADVAAKYGVTKEKVDA